VEDKLLTPHEKEKYSLSHFETFVKMLRITYNTEWRICGVFKNDKKI